MTPRIRLKGFTDAWEQRKLEDISSVITKGTTPKDKSWRGEVNYVKTESIDSNSGNISVMANTSLEEHEGYLKRSQLQDGDVLFTIVGTLGRIGVVKNKDLPANTNQQIAIIRLNNANNRFVFHALKTSRIASFIKSDATIGAQPSLSLWQINGLKIPYPSLKEQDKIGGFFEHLDHLITLHQRKLDLLKEQKKGYLQKMFPKNGAKVPELRFAGFADAWEERKSKDLFTPINERNREDLPVLSVTQDQGVVLRNDLAIDIKYDKSTLSSYKVIHPGDFVISLRSFQGGFELSKVLGISSPAYTIFDLKNLTAHNKLYWKYIFKSFKFIESLKTVTFGIRDGKSISFREFSDLKINYPSDVSEQEKIGSFFKRLDYTIALHQRKLEKLQELKKWYLQKMFV